LTTDDGLGVHAQLGLGHDFEKFVKGSQAARQHKEASDICSIKVLRSCICGVMISFFLGRNPRFPAPAGKPA